MPTRPVALLLFIEIFWTTRGFEHPLLPGVLCLAIFLRGGELLSVDRALGQEI